jgi:GMP reductase
MNQTIIKREYNYSDVYLVPNKTIVSSRKECDTTVKFGNFTFDVPICASNMKSVVDAATCEFFAKNNWFYVMHRFQVNSLEFIKNMAFKGLFTSISAGVNEDTYADLKEILIAGEQFHPNFITLDVANAWCVKAEKMVRWIKMNFPKSFLIVGNMATPEAVKEIQTWGADALKVGIAGGSVCITKNKTGFHRPMISTVLSCAEVADLPVIADGGIAEHGDIAKAIACGATMVMAGNLFAGFDESAGEIIELDKRLYKQYFGSASQFNKGEYKNVEGKKQMIDYKGSMTKLLVEIKEDLQSSISYAGGNDLLALLKCSLITVK